MRKWLRPLAVLWLLALVGCTAAKEPGASKLPEQKVELVVMLPRIMSREAIDDLIDIYEEKHPNVKIRVREMQQPSLRGPDGNTDQSALEGVDILINQAAAVRAREITRDLSGVRLPALDPLVASLVDEISLVDGNRIGIPLILNPRGLLLNLRAFTRANVELPPIDWTIQEFEQSLRQLKSVGVEPNLNVTLVVDAIMAAYGARLIDPGTQAVLIDQPEAVAALTWLGQAVQDGLLSYAHAGQGVMIRIGGPDAPPISANIGGIAVFPPDMTLQSVPRGPAGRTTGVDGILGVVLTSSPNPEVATDFLRESLANPEAQRALARAGIRPLLNDSQALALWREKVGDRTAETVDLGLASGSTEGATWRRVTDELQAFFEGKASLEQLLPTVKQRLSN